MDGGQSRPNRLLAAVLAGLGIGLFLFATTKPVAALGSPNPNQSGGTGLQATIPSPPPQNAPTISVPVSGRSFSNTPITVSGLCTSGLLVKITSNNIFVGAAQCAGGSFSLQIDLFAGRNDLVARQYDALDQSSPASNTVSVTFQSGQFASIANVLSLTTAYAKLGADVGSQLSWPIVLSGGVGPYAISVDWGDGSQPDLSSQTFAGQFSLNHAYKSAGVYIVIVRASDHSGQTAFLQLVGVGNGVVSQSSKSGAGGPTTTKKVLVWWPFAVLVPLLFVSFWLGKRAELYAIHRQLEKQAGR